jgi:hypothetical protein
MITLGRVGSRTDEGTKVTDFCSIYGSEGTVIESPRKRLRDFRVKDVAQSCDS